MEFADSLRPAGQQERNADNKPPPSIPESFEGHLFMELIDHPKILPLIVDACGWNVHMRDCIFSAAPPRGEDSPSPTALAAVSAAPFGVCLLPNAQRRCSGRRGISTRKKSIRG